MDASEKLVADFLAHRGYVDVVYEPDGNVPPDFLVDGRIAVEVRRLNENQEVGTRLQAIEVIDIPVWQKVKKLASSLGPPTQSSSWFVSFRFSYPMESWTKIKPKLRRALEGFINGTTHQKTSVALGNGVELEIFRASNSHPTFYVMASCPDDRPGGLPVEDVARNLQFCVREKAKKIANVRSKYAEWWLVLVDHIAYGYLDEFDWKQIRDQVTLKHNWKKVILISSQDHTRAFEI